MDTTPHSRLPDLTEQERSFIDRLHAVMGEAGGVVATSEVGTLTREAFNRAVGLLRDGRVTG